MRHYPFIGLHTHSERGLSVTIPLYQNYNYGLRWPLPFMVIGVPNNKMREGLERLAQEIKDELNVKKLYIVVERN